MKRSFDGVSSQHHHSIVTKVIGSSQFSQENSLPWRVEEFLYLECVADVDNEGVFIGADADPLFVAKDLQASHLVLVQNRQHLRVRVVGNTKHSRRVRTRWVMGDAAAANRVLVVKIRERPRPQTERLRQRLHDHSRHRSHRAVVLFQILTAQSHATTTVSNHRREDWKPRTDFKGGFTLRILTTNGSVSKLSDPILYYLVESENLELRSLLYDPDARYEKICDISFLPNLGRLNSRKYSSRLRNHSWRPVWRVQK